MYFTNTPALNSMEAIMKKLPYGTQKGGGRFRRLYQYTKKDCDCRLCLYYRKKNGCILTLCPVLDIRLGCGAATIGDAVKAVFKDAQNTAFQKRLSQIYHRKDDAEMIFQNNRYKQIFEAERLSMRKPGKKTLAVLYLLTADHTRDRLRQLLPSDCAGSKQYPQEKKPYPRAGNASGGQSTTEPAEATTAQEINHAAQQVKAPKPVRTG